MGWLCRGLLPFLLAGTIFGTEHHGYVHSGKKLIPGATVTAELDKLKLETTTDEKGLVTNVNLVVGTTNSHAAICMSIKKAAQGVIQRGKEITEGTLNLVEMAFRAYDPCFSCATHSLPGQMALEVVVRERDGTIVGRRAR